MFIIFLTFAENKKNAGEFMPGHNEWIKQGFDDGVFLLVGSIASGAGGNIIAHNTSLEALQNRVLADPFVRERVVEAEVIEISPKKVDERLQFLLEQ